MSKVSNSGLLAVPVRFSLGDTTYDRANAETDLRVSAECVIVEAGEFVMVGVHHDKVLGQREKHWTR